MLSGRYCWSQRFVNEVVECHEVFLGDWWCGESVEGELWGGLWEVRLVWVAVGAKIGFVACWIWLFSIWAIFVAMLSGLMFVVGWATEETVVCDFLEGGESLCFLALILSKRVEYSIWLRTMMLDFWCQAFWKGWLRGRGWLHSYKLLLIWVTR